MNSVVAVQGSLFSSSSSTSDVADARALSLIQPWADAILDGGKRIENRVRWSGSRFRGPVYLHASKGMTRRDYADVLAFCSERRLPWHPVPAPEVRCGGIVGRANVVGVVDAGGTVFVGPPDRPTCSRLLAPSERAWWMGAFALVLADVERVPFVPCSGALGFWRVPAHVLARLTPPLVGGEKEDLTR